MTGLDFPFRWRHEGGTTNLKVPGIEERADTKRRTNALTPLPE